MTAAVMCLCGHRVESHRHYRPGTDCAFCTCSRPGIAGKATPAGFLSHGWLFGLLLAAIVLWAVTA